MIKDKLLELFSKQIITTAATATSDSIALRETGSIADEYGGEPMEMIVQITKAFAGGTSVDFRFVTSNAANLGSPITQHNTGAIAISQLVLGKRYAFPLSFRVADSDATHFGLTAVSLGTMTGSSAFSAWVQRAGEAQHTIND